MYYTVCTSCFQMEVQPLIIFRWRYIYTNPHHFQVEVQPLIISDGGIYNPWSFSDGGTTSDHFQMEVYTIPDRFQVEVQPLIIFRWKYIQTLIIFRWRYNLWSFSNGVEVQPLIVFIWRYNLWSFSDVQPLIVFRWRYNPWSFSDGGTTPDRVSVVSAMDVCMYSTWYMYM